MSEARILLTIILLFVFSGSGFPGPVAGKTEKGKDVRMLVLKAHKIVVEKQLLAVSADCMLLSYSGLDHDRRHHVVTIRELHNRKCGGDPQTSPKLLDVYIQVNTGRVLVMDPIRATLVSP